jgi:hypothetical protein
LRVPKVGNSLFQEWKSNGTNGTICWLQKVRPHASKRICFAGCWAAIRMFLHEKDAYQNDQRKFKGRNFRATDF